ncbi:MAG: amidohydrolase family protein [Syntrophales bacterium]
MNDKLDILIRGGTLLTMSDSMEIIEDPLIGIRDGKILFAGKSADRPAVTEADTVLDASGSIVMPGLINTHTHLPMVCFRGLADDLSLMQWLNDYIFPAEAKFVNREMVYHGAMLAIAEMILSGTTTFADGYFHESSIARAAVDAGMRAVPAQGIIDFSPPGERDIEKHVRIAEAFIRKWADVSPLVSPALFCHSPYSCAAATLKRIKQVSEEAGVPYFIHAAETKDEVGLVASQTGETPIRYLRRLGVLDRRTVAVHCVWLEEDEMDILADYGVSVSHTPESNMKLASGIAPVPRLLEKGVTVGLGTDGCASNNDLDMLLEIDTTAKIHKIACMDPTVMDARTVVRMATIDGARSLGMEDRIGSVEAGKYADLILIDLKKPHLTPLYNIYSHIVYAASGNDVSTSIIHGRIVMRNRRLYGLDAERLIEEVNRIAVQITKSRKSDR